MHGDHSDRVAVTDLRSALLRAGVDANSRVALAAFAELQRTGRTHVDFDAFLRVANAVAAHRLARRAEADGAAVAAGRGAAADGRAAVGRMEHLERDTRRPLRRPARRARRRWKRRRDRRRRARRRHAVVVPDGRAPAAARRRRAALRPRRLPRRHRRRADPAVAEGGARGAADARLWGSSSRRGPGSPPSTGGSSAKKGAVTAEAKRTARRPVEAGAAASPADPYAVVPKVALHKLPPKEPYAAAKAKPPATRPPATKPPTRRRL